MHTHGICAQNQQAPLPGGAGLRVDRVRSRRGLEIGESRHPMPWSNITGRKHTVIHPGMYGLVGQARFCEKQPPARRLAGEHQARQTF